MNKAQVIQLLNEIKGTYGNKFEINEHTPNAWHKYLADMEYELAIKRLARHVEKDDFPPTIADLKNPKGLQTSAPGYWDHDFIEG
jgi:hypothetical protein